MKTQFLTAGMFVGSGVVVTDEQSQVRFLFHFIFQFNSSHTESSSKYHTTLFKVPLHPLQSTASPSSKYHTTIFKVPHQPLQSTTPPFSKYHITLFKVPHQPLQSTTPTSSKYHTTIFRVPHHPLQSTTPPSSKYHITLFKVPNPYSVVINSHMIKMHFRMTFLSNSNTSSTFSYRNHFTNIFNNKCTTMNLTISK